MTKEPWHKGDGKRSPAQRAEYMRDYMRTRRADRVSITAPKRSVPYSEYDVGRHELRDGSGKLMFPERIKGSDTPYSDFIREMEARPSPPPAPAPESPRFNPGPHIGQGKGIPKPRRFEQGGKRRHDRKVASGYIRGHVQ